MSKKKEGMMAALSKNLPADPVKQSKQDANEIQDDYEYSRRTYRDLIDKGSSALDMMMELAADSEHPRAYEVLAKLMKDIGDTTDKLMDLQAKKKDINKEDAPKHKEGVTNNNVFIGSTSDLQRMLIDAQQKDVIDVNGS